MTPIPTVYVFVCGDPDVRGLSLRSDGANLPPLHESTVWIPAAQVPLTTATVGEHVRDTAIALVNLSARGYHLARVKAAMLEFPQAHRRAS